VAFRVRVARFHAAAERAQNRLGGFQFVGEFLQLEQRLHAREKLRGKNRLIEEVVGAGLDAFDLVLAIAEARDQKERNEASTGIFFQLPAEFVAGAPGHHHVGENQIG